MKLLLVTFAILSTVQIITAATTLTAADIIDLEDLVPESKFTCTDNAIYLFHSRHAESTNWIRMYHNLRRFMFRAWNFCNEVPKSEASTCRSNWKISLAKELNGFQEFVGGLEPQNGVKWLDELRHEIDNCLKP